jgi:hypothetical protein
MIPLHMLQALASKNKPVEKDNKPVQKIDTPKKSVEEPNKDVSKKQIVTIEDLPYETLKADKEFTNCYIVTKDGRWLVVNKDCYITLKKGTEYYVKIKW